jgi:hypothetical protein
MYNNSSENELGQKTIVQNITDALIVVGIFLLGVASALAFRGYF